MLLDLIWGDIGVLHHIVEEAGRNHTGAGTDVAQQISNSDRMNDVGIATGPELAFMQLITEVKGRHQKGFWIGGAALANPWRDIGNALPKPLRQVDGVVVRMADGMASQFRQAANDPSRTCLGSGCVW